MLYHLYQRQALSVPYSRPFEKEVTFMQLLAIFSMLIDHIGIIFFPDSTAWRIVGRIAFPIYAYGIAVGCLMTRSRKRYIGRLALLAAIAQVPYMLAFGTNHYNVIFTLLAAALVIFALDGLLEWSARPDSHSDAERSGSSKGRRIAGGTAAALLVAAACILMQELPFDYNAYGLLLILIFRYAGRKRMVMLHLLLNAAIIAAYGSSWALQLFSIAPTLLLAYGEDLRNGLDKLKVPRWLWRSFYPAHLAALAVLDFMLRG
ncbi:Uncharacterized protein BN871_BG_00540 [Paenibacillus sp. P22]|nr:Uncharacterized protein BN871_BG_00540 [Paenibacillus sp. P22]